MSTFHRVLSQIALLGVRKRQHWIRSPLFWVLRGIEWKFLADISGQLIGSIFKGQAVKELEDGTDSLSLNIYKILHFLRYAKSQNTAAEA